MKRLLLTMLVMSAVVFAASAQCTPDTSFTEAGLYPEPDSLDCFVNGQTVNTVIYFKNFEEVSGLTVQSLKINNITNLPDGTLYTLDDPDSTYTSGQAGCVNVTGVVSDAAGQYKLGIYVTIEIQGLPTPVSGEAGSLASQFGAGDFSYYVRVKSNASVSCPAIDTTTAACTCTECFCAYTGINEINNLSSMSFYPNPVSNTANVSFYAANAATYNVRIVNIFGQEVANSTLSVVPGLNNKTMDVSKLSAGVYIYTITDGKSVFTQRFVVE